VAAAELQAISSDNALAKAREDLAVLCGLRPPFNLKPIDVKPELPAEDVEGLVHYGLAHRSELRAADRQMEIADLEIGKAFGEKLPSVFLNFNYTRQRAAFPASSFWKLILSVNVPVFDGGLSSVNRATAEASYRQALLQRQLLRKRIRAEITRAYLDYTSIRKALLSAQKQVELTRRTYEDIERFFKVGEATDLDVQDARQRLIDAERELANLTTVTLPIAASALLVALAACGGGPEKTSLAQDPAGDSSTPAVEESTTVADQMDLAVVQALERTGKYEAIGSFVAKDEITISTKVGGTLRNIAQIDKEDFVLRVRNAEAQLAVSEASLDNARNEFERKKQLFEEEAITQSAFDLVKTQLELAEAQAESARVAVEIAEKALRDTTVKARVKGVVSARLASAGEYLKAGAALVVVSVVKPIEMRFSVPERLASSVCEGDAVTARLAAYPGRTFTGEVILVSPTVDPATRTVLIKAEFGNEDGALKPGFFADCTVTLCSDTAYFLVPEGALFETDRGHELHVKTDDGFAPVPVVKVESRGTLAKIACEFDGTLSGGEQVLLK